MFNQTNIIFICPEKNQLVGAISCVRFCVFFQLLHNGTNSLNRSGFKLQWPLETKLINY